MEPKDKHDLIKLEKQSLHIKYIIGISITIIAVVITSSCYQKTKFVDEVSFAGTISSIILSVIAIIMTIIGETKTDNTKNKLEDIGNNLFKVSEDIKKSSSNLSNVTDINLRMDSLNNILKNTYDKVNETANKMDENWSSYKHDNEDKINYIDLFNVTSKNKNSSLTIDIFIYTMYFIIKVNINKKLSFNTYVKFCDTVLNENIKNQKITNYSYFWGKTQCFTGYIGSNQRNKFEQYVENYMIENYKTKKIAIDKFIEDYTNNKKKS